MSDRSESGFTLVELLIATVISGIIIGGIAGIMIVTLRSYPQSAARLSVSDNPQLLSSYLIPDVQSAGGGAAGIATTGLDNSVCFAPFGVPVANKLSISWTDYTTGGLFRIDYCQIGSQIVRFYRQPGVGSVQQVVSRDLVPNGFVTNLTVDSLTATVTTTDTVNGSPYAFNVTATRRTPALRISPVLTVNLATVSAVVISGTVPGALPVSVSVTDQATPSSPAHQPLVVNPVVPGDGTWSTAPGGTNLSGLNDGIMTFTASATIDGHPATATTTALMDTKAPTATVTVQSQTPWTNVAPVQFLLTFSEPVTPPVLTGAQALVVTKPARDSLAGATVQQATCQPTAAPGSQCYLLSIPGVDKTDDLGDGAITVQVPADAVTDIAGNPNTASGTAATNWDLNPPVVTIAAHSASPTSTNPLVFWATVSKRTTDRLTPADVTAAAPGNPTLTISTPGTCPAGARQECFIINVSGLQNIDNAGGAVTVTVNAGAIIDNFGRSTTAPSTSPAITWSPLTIHETGPATAAVFNGVAAPGTVTVNRCADAACATITLIQTITVNPDGTWATAPPADLTTDTYAEVVQNLNGVITTVIIPVP